MDPTRANELFEVAERLAADARKLRDELEIEFITSQLAEVVATDYDLGEVVGVEQIFGGYVNLSFAVRTRDADGEHRYFVRKYNKAITEREIRFEHALVNHINAKGFHLAARVYPNKGGETFVTRHETANGERLTRFFAVYEMLEGQDKYTWVKNRCTDREFESGGRVLAQFHYLAHDFDPSGLGREQPPIMQLLRDLRPAFAGYAEQAQGRGQHRRRVLPGMAARHRRGPAQGRRAGAGAAGHALHPGPLRLPSRQPQVGRRRGGRLPARGDVGLLVLRAVRLRLVEARLPHLRRGRGHRLLLQLVGGPRQRRAVARQGRHLRARLPGRGGQVRRARRHDGGRARGPAAHDRQRQPLRAQLGRERLLRGRRGPERRRVPDVPEAPGHAHGVHRGPPRRAVRAWPIRRPCRRARRVSTTTRRGADPHGIRRAAHAAGGPPHARGVARGPRGGGHRRPQPARPRDLQGARLQRRLRDRHRAVPGRRRRDATAPWRRRASPSAAATRASTAPSPTTARSWSPARRRPTWSTRSPASSGAPRRPTSPPSPT